MLVDFSCTCGQKSEVYYNSINKYQVPFCPCGNLMQRVYSPVLIKMGSLKLPKGVIELGNEYPKAQKQDHMQNVEKEIHDYINSNSDMELSKLHE